MSAAGSIDRRGAEGLPRLAATLTDDEVRERVLEELGVGTDREERFERITRLAQRLFGVAVAAVTMMGRDRQWYKAVQGFDRTFNPRHLAFCDLTLQQSDPLVVEDMRLDPRFVDNPFVAGAPHIRFYAGQALRAPGGQVIGTLCLMDRRTRRFSEADAHMFHELALWAESEFAGNAEMERAAEVQRGLLPRAARIKLPGFEVAGMCVASRAVSGDLLDFYRTPDGDLVFTLGDVMGKGIGAAILMTAVRAAMRTAGRTQGPAEAIRLAAATLDDDLQETGTIVTLCHARLDPSTAELSYADAGHGLLLLVRDGRMHRRTVSGLPLGVLPDEQWPEVYTHLRPGDAMVCFSDGLLDLYPSIEEAFADVVGVVSAAPTAAAAVAHFEAMARRSAVADDVTMFVLHRPA